MKLKNKLPNPNLQTETPCCFCNKTGDGPIVTINDWDENGQAILIKRFEYCLGGKAGHLFHKLCNDCSDKMRKANG